MITKSEKGNSLDRKKKVQYIKLLTITLLKRSKQKFL